MVLPDQPSGRGNARALFAYVGADIIATGVVGEHVRREEALLEASGCREPHFRRV